MPFKREGIVNASIGQHPLCPSHMALFDPFEHLALSVEEWRWMGGGNLQRGLFSKLP